MTAKFPLLGLVAAALVVGYMLGRTALWLASSRPWGIRCVGLAGAVIFFVGLIADDASRRLLPLAAAGLGLQVAWLLNSKARKDPIHSRLPDDENI